MTDFSTGFELDVSVSSSSLRSSKQTIEDELGSVGVGVATDGGTSGIGGSGMVDMASERNDLLRQMLETLEKRAQSGGGGGGGGSGGGLLSGLFAGGSAGLSGLASGSAVAGAALFGGALELESSTESPFGKDMFGSAMQGDLEGILEDIDVSQIFANAFARGGPFSTAVTPIVATIVDEGIEQGLEEVGWDGLPDLSMDSIASFDSWSWNQAGNLDIGAFADFESWAWDPAGALDVGSFADFESWAWDPAGALDVGAFADFEAWSWDPVGGLDVGGYADFETWSWDPAGDLDVGDHTTFTDWRWTGLPEIDMSDYLDWSNVDIPSAGDLRDAGEDFVDDRADSTQGTVEVINENTVNIDADFSDVEREVSDKLGEIERRQQQIEDALDTGPVF